MPKNFPCLTSETSFASVIGPPWEGNEKNFDRNSLRTGSNRFSVSHSHSVLATTSYPSSFKRFRLQNLSCDGPANQLEVAASGCGWSENSYGCASGSRPENNKF